jgi:hypothetical protein
MTPNNLNKSNEIPNNNEEISGLQNYIIKLLQTFSKNS